MNEMAKAYSVCDAKACAAMFTETGGLHSPYVPPARGRAEIEARHRDWAAEPSQKKLVVVNAAQSGRMAWALVRYSEGAVTGNGTSLSIFEQQDDGSWQISLCCLHGDGEGT